MDSIEQGSEEWFAQRLGKVTASRIADLLAKTKSGWGASRTNYEAQIIAERLTGQREETFKSSAMERGNEVEAEAREAYEFFNNVTVTEASFVDHPTVEMSGASPDGFVGEVGLVEIKCPNTATHLSTLLGGSIKGAYQKQMQWQMACTGRDWCDFVSYDPRMPEHLQMHVKRVERDHELIAEIEKEVIAFLDGVNSKIQQLEQA
jgi:putative phage-type endonuclease